MFEGGCFKEKFTKEKPRGMRGFCLLSGLLPALGAEFEGALDNFVNLGCQLTTASHDGLVLTRTGLLLFSPGR